MYVSSVLFLGDGRERIFHMNYYNVTFCFQNIPSIIEKYLYSVGRNLGTELFH